MNRFARTDSTSRDEGFGLVEVIIAMFLLAIIIIAMLPLLFQGLDYSARQSSVATATRYLNSLVEDAREAGSCPLITAIATPPPTAPVEKDGQGKDLTVSGTVTGCTSGQTARVFIQVSGGGRVLASTTALIYIP